METSGVGQAMTWAQIEAYFVALGFEVRPKGVGSMMRRVIDRTQYIQRVDRAEDGYKWRAKATAAMAQVVWRGLWFDDPISAYVNAEIENWGRP